tara:strand:+ start:518 stop:856 length:339 start_codon:yes stop_codon:yes gene_type:complete
MKDELEKYTNRNDFLLVLKPHVDNEDRWTGEVTVNIITSSQNTLEDDDYFSMMDFTRLVGASVPVMETNPRYRTMLQKQADIHMPLVDKEKRVESVRDNVIQIDFRAEKNEV